MNIKDGDYILEDGHAWLETGAFSVRIANIGNDICVDIYRNGHEMDAPLASCYAINEGA